MANTYYTVGTTAPIAEIKAALISQYGSGNVTVYYETTSYLIFSCSAIANKVIKLYWYSTSNFMAYYGDAWTSGSTITNQVQFIGYGGGTASEQHLVLGDNFFFLATLCSTLLSLITIIAKMTNNDYVCIGLMGNSASTYNANCRGVNTTDAVDVRLSTLDYKFASSTGKLYKQNLIIAKTNGTAEQNTDGSLATINGLYNISHSLSNATLLKGTNYLMSPSNMYMLDLAMYLKTCLFTEF